MVLPELLWKFRSRRRITIEMSERSSGWNKLRQLWRFADDWEPLGLLHFRPFSPFTATFRFSARLWWLGRGTQTWQQFVHPASYLLQRRCTLLVFPRM